MLDLLITDALVVDGGGGPPFAASVGVADGRIAAIVRDDAAKARDDVAGPGASPGVDAARVIKAGRRALAPGFIDVHTHSDLAPFTDPWMDSALRQGVTSVVVGNCGVSVWPKAGLEGLAALIRVGTADLDGGWDSVGDYLAAVDAVRPACNVATLVGFGNLRTEVMGLEQRPASPAEVGEMQDLLGEALAAGALGLSTGLIYVPDMYAATAEVAAVAAALARHGGLYTSHMRAEGRLVFEAVKETLEIGHAAGARPHVSHLKLDGSHVWGRTDELRRLLDEGGATADQYPYTAWETDLSSFLPPWAPVGRLAELLAEPSTRARLVAAVQEGEEGWESSLSGAGWDRIVVEAGPGNSPAATSPPLRPLAASSRSTLLWRCCSRIPTSRSAGTRCARTTCARSSRSPTSSSPRTASRSRPRDPSPTPSCTRAATVPSLACWDGMCASSGSSASRRRSAR